MTQTVESIIFAHAKSGLSPIKASFVLGQNGIDMSSSQVERTDVWKRGRAECISPYALRAMEKAAKAREKKAALKAQEKARQKRERARLARRMSRTPERIIHDVAKTYGVSPEMIGPGGNDILYRAKCVAACRMADEAKLTRDQIGRALGYEEASSVSRMLAKARSELAPGAAA